MMKLILDCDTGTDDAVAMMAAVGHPKLELVAVTTVNGNVPLPNVTENSLRVLDLLGAQIPVHSGSSRAMIRNDFPTPRRVVNDDSRLHPPYLDLPGAVSTPASKSAVSFLIDYYLSDEGPDTVLVATGPLTNIALALAAEPQLAQRIPRLVIMGGARGWGNVTPVAEFNIWADPEAAESVLAAGIHDLTLVPLNATHSAPVSLSDCDRFDTLGSPAAMAASSFIRHRIENYNGPPGVKLVSAPVHDALCVAYLVYPGVLSDIRHLPIHVETRGERTIGQTVVDSREWSTEAPNAQIALDASSEIFVNFLVESFGG